MADVPAALIADQLTKVLREAFDGPPGPWSYFTDAFPSPGLLGTVSRLSAADASRAAGANHSTIAGHVHHLCSSLAISIRWIRGELESRGRNETWKASAVDDAAWTDLQARLRREYHALTVTLETQKVWGEEATGGALGAIAHVAYHLGAIRQRLALESAA